MFAHLFVPCGQRNSLQLFKRLRNVVGVVEFIQIGQ